jgi:hypothetical protein
LRRSVLEDKKDESEALKKRQEIEKQKVEAPKKSKK